LLTYVDIFREKQCFKNDYLKVVTLPENFKMKYSYLKDNNDGKTKDYINQYMTVWSDFLKILSMYLTSTISRTKESNASKNKLALNPNSELFNETVSIHLLASTEEERIKNITEIETSLTQKWAIFGQEFINVII